MSGLEGRILTFRCLAELGNIILKEKPLVYAMLAPPKCQLKPSPVLLQAECLKCPQSMSTPRLYIEKAFKGETLKMKVLTKREL